MRKMKIEIRTNIAVYADAHKTTQLAVDDWFDKTIDIANSNEEAEIDLTNVKLAEFGVYIEIFLVDSICKTCYK